MMRISDLLNSGDHSDEDEVAQIIDAQYRDEPTKLRRATSASQYDEVHPRHGYDDDVSSGADDTGRLSETTSYASSLLDALSLQYVVVYTVLLSALGVCMRANVVCALVVSWNLSRSMAKLNSKRSPTALNVNTSPNQRRFLDIQSLTNPEGADEMKQEESTVTKSGQPPTKKRSTRSLFPTATDSDRRAKQRMIVKRCYYKKIVRSCYC